MTYYKPKNRKYGNRRAEVDGIAFDSKKEARRWRELTLLQEAGKITDLRRQVKYTLIPAQREFNGREIYTKGRHKGCFKPGKLLEREVAYYADFVYIADGMTVVEDTKGVRTSEYIIKRKLMLWRYGLRIREI